MERQVAPVWSPSQAAAQREAKRKSEFYSFMNLWPFLAVLLVLLIIFMVKDPPILHDIGPDLPSSFFATAQPKALAEDAMKISIMRDGRVYFRNYMAEPKSLPILIRNGMQEGAEKKVYLAVDSRARFGDVAVVVEQIGKAGLRDVCFLTEKVISQ